ncbi:MAG TPA: M20/M25/M40 family metallo-hydrolase, partial [Virgibacillus sp.]
MNSAIEERLFQIYQDLHKCPERGWEETQTTAYLVEFLQNEGLEPQTFSDMTGLYVDIGKGEPTVGFRTDIDALWQEVDGIFQANHSCGHDGHMTVALGVLLRLKEELTSGAVRVIFQPAEETGQGAKAIAETGIIDSLTYLYGTHVRPIAELSDGTYAPAIQHGAAKMIQGE